MNRKCFPMGIRAAWIIGGLLACTNATTQEKPKQPPAVDSPEVLSDGRIVFRILAPDAQSVGLQASDIPGSARTDLKFAKTENGVWEAAVGPVPPGAYRYVFLVDGIAVVDPRNPSVSESNNNCWSLVYVPGADFMEAGRVPHGAVAAVHYYSTVLGRARRMHVYTPPGYESGKARYPVLYLLHGAMDCDDSWSSVGRAGFILDNLIASKKAKPMIVVMPAGHTSRSPRAGAGRTPDLAADEFVKEFTTDIVPCIETRYRVLGDRHNRAIAGLSMGGMQTLNIAMSDLGNFGYVGVFSSGIFGPSPKAPAAPGAATPRAPRVPPEWEEKYLPVLQDARLKKNLRLLWFATGSEDFLVETTRATVELFKKHGFDPVYKESGGGHTWINWRHYLYEFAPQLFGRP